METEILIPLLNREFKLPEDGLFQFAPLGEFPIIDPVTKNRVIQVVDAESVKAMAADIAAHKAKSTWPGLLVDRDHFSYDQTKESRAAGWANDAADRGAKGLWGPIRFTNSGKSDVEGGEFRFLSPVFDRRSSVPLGGNRYRVVKLLGLALTNTPNIRNIQALTNRAEEFHGREAITTEDKKMNKLIALLGLAATATEDDIVAKVQAFKNRVAELEPLSGRLTTLETEHTALKNRHNTLLTSSVDKTLDEYKGVITEESKDAWKNRLTADFDGSLVLLKGLKPAGKDTRKPVHSPGKGAAAAATTTGEDEPDASQAFMNRVREVMTAEKLTEPAAIEAVAQREPDLYEEYNGLMMSRG